MDPCEWVMDDIWRKNMQHQGTQQQAHRSGREDTEADRVARGVDQGITDALVKYGALLLRLVRERGYDEIRKTLEDVWTDEQRRLEREAHEARERRRVVLTANIEELGRQLEQARKELKEL